LPNRPLPDRHNKLSNPNWRTSSNTAQSSSTVDSYQGQIIQQEPHTLQATMKMKKAKKKRKGKRCSPWQVDPEERRGQIKG